MYVSYNVCLHKYSAVFIRPQFRTREKNYFNSVIPNNSRVVLALRIENKHFYEQHHNFKSFASINDHVFQDKSHRTSILLQYRHELFWRSRYLKFRHKIKKILLSEIRCLTVTLTKADKIDNTLVFSLYFYCNSRRTPADDFLLKTTAQMHIQTV